MRFDSGQPTLPPPAHTTPASLSPAAKGVVLGLIAALCFVLGALMDISTLVMALGLFNVAIVAFLLLKKDITWGFLFYLTTSIFFQFGFWIRLPGFPDLFPARIASLLLYLVFLIQIMLSLRATPALGRIEKTMIIFMAVLFMSIVTTGQRPHWILLMNGYVYPFLFFYFARAVMNVERPIRIVLIYLIFIGLYCGIMGVFEKMKWYGLVFPKFIVDPSIRDDGLTRLGFRVRGIFLMPPVLGTVICMGFFPSWLYLQRLRGIIPMIVRITLLVVTPATIFFTQTRSAYAAFAMALVVGIVKSRKLRPLCLGIVLMGMVAVFLTWDQLSTDDRDVGGMGNTETIDYRINLLYEAGEIFLDNPLFGCGFKNFTTIAADYRKPRDVPFFGHIEIGYATESISHNAFVTVFAEQGLLGFVPYILIYVFVFLATIRAYRILPEEGLLSKDFVVSVWMAMAAYLANAMFIEIRQFEYINVLQFFLVGIVIGVMERVERERRTRAVEPRFEEALPLEVAGSRGPN